MNIKESVMQKADIGLIGLAVMGENLVLNMESKGFRTAVFNRTTEKVSRFINGRGAGKNIIGAMSVDDFVDSIEVPRKIMLMVKAGPAVDATIESLLHKLDKGDIIIDGGNSNFKDSMRRYEELKERGILFVGAGVSGGEEGALKGPSIMPGGNHEAWQHIGPIFRKISARAHDGKECSAWIGEGGAGHFVKMVHNGIEYGDMQLIAEAYSLMKNAAGMSNEEMADTFAEWNEGELNSYLIEISADILRKKDEDGSFVIDKILDCAGQKGTGKWTAVNALDAGTPLTLIGEAVFARFLSSQKDERITAQKSYGMQTKPEVAQKIIEEQGGREGFLAKLKNALYLAKIISYAQGFALLKSAADIYGWQPNYGEIAMIWRGGCIIRSIFLDKIKEAYAKEPGLNNLLLDDFFKGKMQSGMQDFRDTVSSAVLSGTAVPALSSALAYFDGYVNGSSPANMIQAQRDYFGAHTYERVDKARGEFFHTNWTGEGGNTVSSSYNA